MTQLPKTRGRSRSPGNPAEAAPPTAIGRWLRRIYHRLPQPPSTNFEYATVRPSPYELLPANPVIYDIGSKNARAGYFGGPPPGATVTCIDVSPGPGVDIVADAQDMPQVPSQSADCVMIVSVLQHVPSPQRVVEEAFRILRPGGIIYVNVPFIFAYHRDPEDYNRFSVPGLEALCGRFEKIASGSVRGPASTFCDLLIKFLGILLSFNSNALHAVVVYCSRWTLFWIKYLDFVIGHYPTAYIIAGSPHFIGRKPLASAAPKLSD
ncbi:MAG TPA: class I SAM-dependent methyltransferase [Stellaceae bacterium]|jgi:SAM-dependent methyltransferase